MNTQSPPAAPELMLQVCQKLIDLRFLGLNSAEAEAVERIRIAALKAVSIHEVEQAKGH